MNKTPYVEVRLHKGSLFAFPALNPEFVVNIEHADLDPNTPVVRLTKEKHVN